MSETKHTLGPWKLLYRDIGGPFLEGVIGPDGEKIRLIGIALAMNSRDSDPEPEANARLIAAAPEMLAALEAAVNWYTPPNDSRTAFPLKQITAALAKATGA